MPPVAFKFENVPDVVRRRMSRVRSKGTTPEMNARRAAHRLGYRFRLHRRDLPGTPDLTFPRLRKVVMVNGCFWHQHPRCPRATTPRTRPEYWLPKLARNVARDAANVARLNEQGWDVLVLWECEARTVEAAAEQLARFLSRPHAPPPASETEPCDASPDGPRGSPPNGGTELERE